VAFGEPGVTGDVDSVEKEGATSLHRLNRDGWGDGWIREAQADATKGRSLIAVGFGSDEITVGGATPEVSAAGMEEGARENAKGPDELAGIAALKSGLGKLKEKLLESLVRLRRVAGTRISGVGCQWAPIA
jgi:hypothetical protein